MQLGGCFYSLAGLLTSYWCVPGRFLKLRSLEDANFFLSHLGWSIKWKSKKNSFIHPSVLWTSQPHLVHGHTGMGGGGASCLYSSFRLHVIAIVGNVASHAIQNWMETWMHKSLSIKPEAMLTLGIKIWESTKSPELMLESLTFFWTARICRTISIDWFKWAEVTSSSVKLAQLQLGWWSRQSLIFPFVHWIVASISIMKPFPLDEVKATTEFCKTVWRSDNTVYQGTSHDILIKSSLISFTCCTLK